MSSVSTTALRVTFAVCGALMALGCGRAKAQTFASYAQFQQMTLAQLDGLQVKLAIAGGQQLSPTRNVGFTATGHAFSVANFVSHYRPSLRRSYIGDIIPPHTFAATAQQLKAMIDSIGTLSGVTPGGVDAAGYVSFALMNKIGPDTLVFEAVVDTGNGRKLFKKMISAMSGNALAVTTLSDMACVTDMTPTGTPRDASGDVSVRVQGVRQDRQSRQFIGTIRVSNTSLNSLSPPLILVLRAKGNVDLANPDGRTCRIFPTQSSFLNLPVGAALLPGAHVDVTARFTNPDSEPIKFDYMRVFEGQGTQ